MPRKICIADLVTAKSKHHFNWEWEEGILPEQRTDTVRNSRSWFNLTCGKCKQKKWVEWTSLRDGKTRQCKSCTRLPTIQRMRELAFKYNTLWKPSTVCKTDPVTGRRSFLMTCACFKKQWVRWNHFSMGLTKGCKSCMSARRIDGRSKEPLHAVWKNLCKNGHLVEFKDYKDFKKWAEPLWSKGFKLVRYDRNLPYRPDNCDFELIKKGRIAKSRDHLLPGGKSVRGANRRDSPFYTIYHGLKGRGSLGPEWNAFPLFEAWAKTTYWVKGSYLAKRDENLPHGPQNSYWERPIRKVEYQGQFYTFKELAMLAKHPLSPSIVRRRIVKLGMSPVQAIRKRRIAGKISYYGKEYTIEQLCELSPHKMNVTTLRARLKKGMSVRDALKTPVAHRIRVRSVSE